MQSADRGEDGADHRAGDGHLGQLEGDGAGVADDTRPDLDQLQLQAGQRPLGHFLGQLDTAQEGGQVVGQCMQLQAHLIVAELPARQPRPAEGVFAFLDVLLGGAALVVEPHHPVRVHGQIGNDEADLWMDAGMVTTQADWSLDFDIGMNFFEWHAPVPLAHEKGIFVRALKFLLNIQQGAPVRRLNWTMTVNPLLDTSPENYHKWGVQKTTLTPQNIGAKQHLRVELQTFYRLPRSNALVFPIRCYLCSFQDLMSVPKWGRRLHRVVRDLPDELATYKGFIANRPMMLDYLTAFDDGLPTSPGIWPDLETEPKLQT